MPATRREARGQARRSRATARCSARRDRCSSRAARWRRWTRKWSRHAHGRGAEHRYLAAALPVVKSTPQISRRRVSFDLAQFIWHHTSCVMQFVWSLGRLLARRRPESVDVGARPSLGCTAPDIIVFWRTGILNFYTRNRFVTTFWNTGYATYLVVTFLRSLK